MGEVAVAVDREFELLQRGVEAMCWRGPCRADFLACELVQIEHTVGMGMNAVLKRESQTLLDLAVAAWEETRQPQRRFTAFEYQAGSWEEPRWVVVRCETNGQGTNRRTVVTSRPGARVVPHGDYEDYADCGESENRNKELKCKLAAGRLSDHRYLANAFLLIMHTLAANLLVRLRRVVAKLAAPQRVESDLPFEAQSPRDKRRHWGRRRQDDL